MDHLEKFVGMGTGGFTVEGKLVAAWANARCVAAIVVVVIVVVAFRRTTVAGAWVHIIVLLQWCCAVANFPVVRDNSPGCAMSVSTHASVLACGSSSSSSSNTRTSDLANTLVRYEDKHGKYNGVVQPLTTEPLDPEGHWTVSCFLCLCVDCSL